MIKKFIFVVLAVCGFGAVAEEAAMPAMDHMSDMMSGSVKEESSLKGSVWLKYKHQTGAFSYRARLGWTGDVTEDIRAGVGVSSDLEQAFASPKLQAVFLEQAYVSYLPAEGLFITAGKKGWTPDFHKVGVLYDERLYNEGVYLKYRQGEDEDVSFYGKLGLASLSDNYNKPLTAGPVLKGKVGGKFAIGDEMDLGVFVSAYYDGLKLGEESVDPAPATADPATKEEKPAEGEKPAESESTASPAEDSSNQQLLAQAGLNLSFDNMAVPVGLFAIYVTNSDFGSQHSFTGGVYVGSAGSVSRSESGDFGVAVSYYDIKAGDYVTGLANRDYVNVDLKSAEDKGVGKGVAVRAQYNIWDNTNFVAKAAYGLGGDDSKWNTVGELTFHF